MTLCKKSKIPTHHVIARYLGRAYPKGGPKKSSPGVDHNDGPFFSAMEWLMFFFRPPLTTMVFQWFYHHWTITIECFWRVQPLVSMVFQCFFEILRPMVNDGLEVNDGLHKKVRKINSRQNAKSPH